jgi:hypothetical protein
MHKGVGSKPGPLRTLLTDQSLYGGQAFQPYRPGAMGLAVPIQPGGRLTLSTATPVMSSTVSGATTVYYTPYLGRYVPIWNGLNFVMVDFGGELSQATTDGTKSPAAVTTSSNYDYLVWWDPSVGRCQCTRGFLWSSDTARGTGSGTAELELLNGIYVNKYDVTNGPKARRGTYVGTVRSNGSSTIDFNLGSAASGGGAATLYVFNAYNQIEQFAYVQETAGSWAYASATVRPSNGSTGNRISMINGIGVGFVTAIFAQRISSSGGTFGSNMIGLDSTTAMATLNHRGFVFNGTDGTVYSHFIGPTGLGYHYLQCLESSGGSATYLGNTSDFGFFCRWWG